MDVHCDTDFLQGKVPFRKALLDTNILAEVVKPKGNPAENDALAKIPLGFIRQSLAGFLESKAGGISHPQS